MATGLYTANNLKKTMTGPLPTTPSLPQPTAIQPAAAQPTAAPQQPAKLIGSAPNLSNVTQPNLAVSQIYGAKPITNQAQPLQSVTPANTVATPGGAASSAPNYGKQVADDIAAGKSMMGDLFADGSLGRMTDSRAAEMQALLDRQKAGLDGMTPEEMQAAREQGISGINQQLSTNMRQFGDMAAANGVRGGSAMGLQMQALGQAQNASGELSRKLILDNMGQKNIAMDRYGNTLTGQQKTELGIQDKNLGLTAQEKLGQATMPLEYAGMIDSYRSSGIANGFQREGIDLAKAQIDALKAQGATTAANKVTEDAKVADSTATDLLKTMPIYDSKGTKLDDTRAKKDPLVMFLASKGISSRDSIPASMFETPEYKAALKASQAAGNALYSVSGQNS
jgi:hypothetical protein